MASKHNAELAPEPVDPNEPQPAPVDPHAPDQPAVGEPEVSRDESNDDEQAEQPANPNLPTYTTNPTPLDEHGNPV